MNIQLPSALAALGPFTWLEAGLIFAVLILSTMLWKLTRHEECSYLGEPDLPIDQALHSLAGSTHGHLHHGNSVSIIQDEAYFTEVVEAMENARASVHFETYLWDEGAAGSRIADSLIAAATRGLAVRVLMDASGSIGLKDATVERMKSAGCKVHRFHQYRPHNFGRLNVRDHRKILIADGRVGFVGGHCVTDNWLQDGKVLSKYRDITARVTGPVVGSIQSCFLENWTEVSGELFIDATTFPELEETGSVITHVAYIKADRCPSAVQVLHHLSIGYAKKRIRIQNPYFLPDPNGVTALVKAVARGVDVRVMVPAVTATDSPSITRAGHYQFQKLLTGGVRIFEYQKTLLHQKVISIDGVWCGIGSSNFDDRSFEINDEIALGIADPEIALQLEGIFDRDAEDCAEIHLEQWRSRRWWTKVYDAFMYLFNEQF